MKLHGNTLLDDTHIQDGPVKSYLLLVSQQTASKLPIKLGNVRLDCNVHVSILTCKILN